jgi:ppGpp synthetase/RelA/SpoT-type nucleotidyltranferase
MIAGLQMIEKNISEKISDELDKIGLLHRLFSRTKDDKSIKEKITRKIQDGTPYEVNGKKIQDLIGIRIVTYFSDDISLVKKILNDKFSFQNEEIDDFELTVFKPKRTNIVYSFNSEQTRIFLDTQTSSQNESLLLVDNTFELQLRTMLSEGWHEIDHSLRYKCKSDWESHKEKERLLNGIYANLETNDIALKSLFNELAYQHFKNKNWEALIRTKFRLKFQLIPIKPELTRVFNNDNNLAKKIIKLDRGDLLLKIAKSDLSLPVNINNLIYIINHFELKDENIYTLTPEIIKTYNLS